MDTTIKQLNDAGLGAVFVGSTNGGEYKAACPFCRIKTGDGGKDRFCIWPAEGRAWCRQCKRRHSLAEVLATLAGVSAGKAERLLGSAAAPARNGPLGRRDRLVSPEAWQTNVDKLVRTRAKALFTEDCAEHLDHLRSRGLHEETIRAARLGGCFEDRYYAREDFGLKPETNPKTGKPRMLRVPEGILIPYFDTDGVCRKAQSRCADERNGRYRNLPGSDSICMLLRPAGTIRAVVVLESALDAILCHQEVPEDFAFVALGSTAYRPDEASDEVLRSAAHVLIAMDSDRAGAEAYYSLLERYPNASRLIVPPDLGKDVGEAFLQDMTVRDWCETGLEMAEQGTREVAAGGKRRGAAKRTVPAVEVTNTGLNIPYTLVVSPKQLKTALAELLEAECVAVDIETAPLPRFKADPKAALDPWRARPRLVQATNGGEIYIFDLDRVPLGDLAPLFRKGWVAHNAVFDYKHLLQAELDPEPAPPFCTMLCDNALMNQNRSLADLFEVHFGLALDKTLQDSDWSGGDLSEAQLQYAARDVAAVQRLWEKLRWEVTERRRNELAKLLHGAQRAVALMELNGIGFDAGAHTESVKAWRKEQGRALAALHELAGADLNPNSHAQLAAYLDTHLDEAARRDWPRTESGQLTTAAKEVAAFRGVPAVDLFLDYRHWADLVGKFGDKLSAQVNPVTGRLHPHFGIAGARTGRLSASNPNVQGLPHDPAFRRLFVPQPGHVLVRADYNQMQLRVAAILSGDARLLDAYERGLDVHRLTAASVLAKRPGDVTPEERSLAKAIAFGILFGIGPKALRGYALNKYGVRISVGEAAQVRNRFFETYPDVRRWQLAQAEEAQRTCCSVTPMGRVRNFAREDKDDFHTAAMNTPIQGGEGEVILAALALLPEALDPLDGLLVNCVHDEVLVECPESTATGVEAVLVDCMKRGMQHVFPAASLKGLVEVGHGPTWADAKGK